MALFNDEIRGQLSDVFKSMNKEVNVVLFTKQEECDSCQDTKDFINEISDLGPKIKFTHYDINKDTQQASELNVELTPSIVLLDEKKKDYGVKFNGIPAGHEINSFITGLLEMSGAGEPLPATFKTRIDQIKTPTHIRVFVTLGCPHCPGAVSKAHKLAMENEHITAEMIEASTFPELSDKFNVSSVPRIIFNDDHDLLGDQPMDSFITMIESLNGK